MVLVASSALPTRTLPRRRLHGEEGTPQQEDSTTTADKRSKKSISTTFEAPLSLMITG